MFVHPQWTVSGQTGRYLRFAGQGTTAVRGTEAALTLRAASLPLPAKPNALNFAYVGLSTPSPAPSTSTPAPSPGQSSAGATTGPTVVPAGDGGTGGGLP